MLQFLMYKSKNVCVNRKANIYQKQDNSRIEKQFLNESDKLTWQLSPDVG